MIDKKLFEGHTAGEWWWSIDYKTAEGEKTFSLLGDGGYGILMCDGVPNSPQGLGKHGESDAALIAAAPSLLLENQSLVELVRAQQELIGHISKAISQVGIVSSRIVDPIMRLNAHIAALKRGLE